MSRRKRTWWASDDEYEMIRAYAKTQRRSVSAFVLHYAMREVTRRMQREGLLDVLTPRVVAIVREELKNALDLNAPRGAATQASESYPGAMPEKHA